jgi:hypothetical protein
MTNFGPLNFCCFSNRRRWSLAKLFSELSDRVLKLPRWAKARIALALYALAIRVTTIVIYDRVFVPKNLVAFAHENAPSWPAGNRDMSTILSARWRAAPDIGRRSGTQRYEVNTDWPYDHIKIC